MEGLSKTPDEIKRGLKCCSGNDNACDGCPYANGECILFSKVATDALAYIRKLEADNAQLNRCIENMTDKLNAAHDETVELKRERDALLEGLERADLGCEYCKHCNSMELDADKCPCNKCRNNSHWEWAGIKEDNQ